MKIRRGTKKILAGFMAMSMVLSCGVVDLLRVSADEGDQTTSRYTVTLKDTDTGTLAFAGAEEKELDFASGESVTVVPSPADGYEDQGIHAENADTGEEIDLQASKEDNGYVFNMPEANINLTGLYSEVKAEDTAEENQIEDAPKVSDSKIVWGKDSELIATDRIGVAEGGMMPRSAAGSLCNISYGASHNYGSWFTREFSVATETGTYTGYCVQPLTPPPSGTYQVSLLNNDLIKALLLIAPGGPYYDPYGEILFNGDNNAYAYAHAALSYAYEGSLTGLSASMQEGVRRMVDQYGQAIVDGSWALDVHAVLDEYQAYIAYNDLQHIVWLERKPQGDLSLSKKSSNTSLTDGNGCYTLAGATYGIYTDSGCSNQVATFTTDASGKTGTVRLDAGSYYVKEISAPTGYALDTTVHAATVTAGGSLTLDVSDTPVNDPFTLTLEKIDDGKETSDPQGNASLAGAEFTVKYYAGYYTKSNLPEEATKTWVFQTKELENPSTGEIAYYLRYSDDYKVSGPDLYKVGTQATLPLGTITIEETKAPEGYTLDNKTMTSIDGEPVNDGVYLAQIRQVGDLGKVQVGNEFTQNERVIRGGVMVQKRDNDTGKTTPQAGLTFEGTELEIYNRSENSVVVDGKEYEPGEVVMTLVLDENGYAETTDDALPYGDYEIIESVPPTGYLNEGVISREFTIEEDGQMIDLTEEDTSIRNNLIRGDFEITKIDSNSQEAMAGVQFRITHVETGESHIITTDENGFYSSASEFNKHTQDTNGGEATSGLWFGEEPVLDERGAMPYGVYTIEELEGEANEGMVMYKSTFTISRDSFTVDLGNIENRPITLETTAKDQDTNNHYTSARNEVTIVDEIFYTGVVPDQEYTVVGTLMDKTTGLPVKDANGNEVTAERTFTPVATTGTVEMEFLFNASEMAGMDLVVFEEMYDAEGILVGQHTDLNDTDQSIYVSCIETTAIDTATDAHVGKAQETTLIVDTVAFDNVRPGYEYTLEGKLYDRDTQEPLLDKDGNEITASTVFTPQEDHGNAIVQFTLDTSDLAGKTIVVYQQLIRRGEVYAWHEDILSESQAIHYPVIGTQALDSETGIQNSLADESITINDTVKYENVVPGLTYTVEGTLYDKETGEPLIVNGEEVTASTTFVPNSADGKVVVAFTFDGSDLAGKTLVCFEKLLYNNVELTSHELIDSSEQSIYVPEIGTESKDAENGTQTSMADEDITVTDTVSYKNLIPNTTYTVKGQLYDQETGEPMLDDNGDVITASKEFTPEESSGTVEITFNFSGVKLAGTVGVAFEEVYYENHLVGVHASLEDESQMGFYPELGTSAAGDVENLVYADENATITDTVTYSGLQPGEEYVLTGQLMDQDTEEPILDKDGNAITAQTTFTPENTSGEVDVVFEFDATDLAGTKGVVYERLTVDGELVGSHEIPDAESQFFYIPELKTSAVDEETGIQNSYADDKVTINDTVTYKGMAPGKSYTLKGTLYDPETGEPFLVNGEEVTAETVFTAEESEGEATVTFEFDATGLEGRTFVVYERAYYMDELIADHCDPSDISQTIFIPSIETTATDVENGTHTSNADEEVTVKDTVDYTNLIPGKTYTMDGVLMVKETGEPLVDEDGNEVTASVTFTPESADGSVELTFTFDGSLLAGKELIAFETCSYEGKTVGTHTDLTDTSQTIWLPELQTLALDTNNGTHLLYAGENASITDTVTYKGLQPGEEYVLISTLYDLETGKPLVIPDTVDNAGEDSEATAGDSDEAQDTDAAEDVTEEAAEDETITEAEPGSAEGTDADTEAGEEAPADDEVTGQTVVVETTFTPEASEGSVDTIIPFDASRLAGKTVVVFQRLMVDGHQVGSHEDLYSESQQIMIPKIGTTALDKDTQDHITNADNNVTIVDEVAYENLIPGETYTLQGILMDKETGEPVMARVYKEAESTEETTPDSEEPAEDADSEETGGGEDAADTAEENPEAAGDASETVEEVLSESEEQVTSTVTFTPEEASGTIEVVFHFDACNLAGHDLVVFESAYLTETEALVADHCDLQSTEQGISVPEIRTVATDKADGDHFVLVPGEQTIVDTVSYTNLIPGKEYTLKGTLMDKETGEPLVIDGEEVTAQTVFTPETADGETTIEFTINTEGLANKSAVCFEKVYYGDTDIEVGSHEDLTDEDQSIQFIEEAYQTGVNLFGTAAFMLAFALVELAALVLLKSRRR